MAHDWNLPMAYVLRSSTSGFSAGAALNQLDVLAFGMIVKAQPGNDPREAVYGLMYDIHIDDDPLVRQLVLADAVSEETVRDQRHHRIAPVEMNILSIGYRDIDGRVRQALPPRPPISLAPVFLCTDAETAEITSRFDYFRLVLSASGVPSEQLLAANLLRAADTRPPDEQSDFLVEAGREAARLLSADMARLDNLLRLIYPYSTVTE
jgi:hypothetical protein